VSHQCLASPEDFSLPIIIFFLKNWF
jgi:hypothetical protein